MPTLLSLMAPQVFLVTTCSATSDNSVGIMLTLSFCWLISPLGQNGRHVADDIFRCIFMNEKFYILIKISLKFVPKGPIDNNPALV